MMGDVTIQIRHKGRVVYDGETSDGLFFNILDQEKRDVFRALIGVLEKLTGWGRGPVRPTKEKKERPRLKLISGGRDPA